MTQEETQRPEYLLTSDEAGKLTGANPTEQQKEILKSARQRLKDARARQQLSKKLAMLKDKHPELEGLEI